MSGLCLETRAMHMAVARSGGSFHRLEHAGHAPFLGAAKPSAEAVLGLLGPVAA